MALIDPAYPNAASDPRLLNVRDAWKDLQQKIDNADWDGVPVQQADRSRCYTLRQMMHDGILYTAKF
jgi:hypothetical protein